MEALPLSIRDVSPSPDAVRLTGLQAGGLPSGFHTGGAWLVGDEVWKPLDGRPYANCENHYPTQEAEALEAMAEKPLFPRNWRVEEANGRRFLVRRRAWIVGQDAPYSGLSREDVLKVERAVREFNRRGWEMNDELALAIDPVGYELFFYDLSAAYYRGSCKGKGCYAADDEWRIFRFFEQCGMEWLVKLRNKARHVVSGLDCADERRAGYVHVYASFNRPVSTLWAEFPCPVNLVHNDRANWNEGIPHTWVIAVEPLDTETVHKYELTWGWSPIHDLKEQWS